MISSKVSREILSIDIYSSSPALAAPLLPEILLVVSRVARETQFSWELDTNVFIPSNSRSIAKQFIRCVLHQLSGNGIFWMIFHLKLQEEHRLVICFI